MDDIFIKRLKAFGINHRNSYFEILEDLLNLAEHLSLELELQERERFGKEIKRLKTPTN